MTRLLCTFLPQEWVGDTAYPVQRDRRPNQWEVAIDEAFVAGMIPPATPEEFMERLEPHSYESDQLITAAAPEWVREWGGPFEVEYEEIEESSPPLTDEDYARAASDMPEKMDDFVEPWMSDPYEVRTRAEIVIGEDRVPTDVLIELIKAYGTG